MGRERERTLVTLSYTSGIKIGCSGECQRAMFCMCSLPQKKRAASAWLIVTCQIPAWVINNKKGLVGLNRHTGHDVGTLL